MKRKTKRYKVTLAGQITATATLEVEALSEEEAREYAEENYFAATWDGGDYTTPDGSTVEAVAAEVIK